MGSYFLRWLRMLLIREFADQPVVAVKDQDEGNNARCDTTDGRLPICEAWMAANAVGAEHLTITTQRFFKGHPGPAITWKVFIAPPAQ